MQAKNSLEAMFGELQKGQAELSQVVGQFHELQQRITSLGESAKTDPVAAGKMEAFSLNWNSPDETGKSLKQRAEDVLALMRSIDSQYDRLSGPPSEPSPSPDGKAVQKSKSAGRSFV
ncbi:hypothetical protein EOS_35780 [Caballeronia mineralivorans PML1(12)]|uniref:Uncharacterized protein n=1 Tax=Caballeronia mineralivorans PML1(12) TaxID=908627 RepID=A0A0J1CL85_9BURK|nr:hypothetical protein [Caballeronia mineralivorans]KLU21525.1 hypothetical protein EOS_35780 [Caballeronia mineralivorans PML1(12)]